MSLLRTLDEHGLRPWLKCRKLCMVRGDGVHLHNRTYSGLPHLVALIGKRIEVVYEEPRCKSIEIYYDERWIGTAVEIRYLTEQQRLRMYTADSLLRAFDQADRDRWLERAAGRAWAKEQQPHPIPDESPALLDALDTLRSRSAAELEALTALTAKPQPAGHDNDDFARPRYEHR